MSKIRVIVDSPSDLSLEDAAKENILVIPVSLSLDNDIYKDKYEMTAEEFYKLVRSTDKIPKTMQIPPVEFEEIFREQAKEYDELIVITIGKRASGIYQNAVLVAKELEEELGIKIHIVDSKGLSFEYGYPAMQAGRMVKEGSSADEVLSYLDRVLEQSKTYFTVETLEYLKKGGRITTTSAIIGGLLDIRPVFEVNNGLVTVIDKTKGEKKIFSKFADIALKEAVGKKIFILNSDVDEKADKLKKIFEEKGLTVAGINKLGPIICCHAGPGVFGFCIVSD